MLYRNSFTVSDLEELGYAIAMLKSDCEALGKKEYTVFPASLIVIGMREDRLTDGSTVLNLLFEYVDETPMASRHTLAR